MNLENFQDFIKDPSNLYRISYQELKSLVLQYPYALNLRLLLLKKSRMEKHPDFERNLQLASTYSLNRELLFEQLQNPKYLAKKQENFALEEDFLELKDLTELGIVVKKEAEGVEEETLSSALTEPDQLESWLDEILAEEGVNPENVGGPMVSINEVLETIPEEQVEFLGREKWDNIEVHDTKEIDLDIIDDASVIADWIEKMNFEEETSGHEQVDIDVVSTSETKTNLKEDLSVTKEMADKEQMEFKRPEPLPKTSFTSWLKQFESPRTMLKFPSGEVISVNSGKKKKKKSRKKSVAEIVAAQSVKRNEEIISETLAGLLVKQGQIEEAIEMYEKLSLKFPEKSTYFAVQIENLKK